MEGRRLHFSPEFFQEPSLIGNHVPEVFSLHLNSSQDPFHVFVARLPHAVVLHEGADRFEVYPEAGKKTQKRRFHDREPVCNTIFGTHFDNGLHEAQCHAGHKQLFVD